MFNQFTDAQHAGSWGKGLASCIGAPNFAKAVRALAPLPFFAQQQIDQQVLQVGLSRLVVMKDFLVAGLVFPIPDWLGVMSLYWESEGRIGGAKRSMVPKTRGENQRLDRAGNRLPLFCTSDDFDLDIRTLAASQRANQPLDVSEANQATRRVNEALEDQAINGWALNVAGQSAPGLLNAPNANQYNFIAGKSWTDPTKTGGDMLNDVKAQIAILNAKRFYGPYNLYLPTDYGIALISDFKDFGDNSILARLQQVQAGGRNLQIRVADQMPEDTTALVQMTSDVADVVLGQEPTPFSWEDASGWNRTVIILACMVLRVRSNYENKSGICIGTL